jgi:D-alanyl-D-alanine carboxypeptidase
MQPRPARTVALLLVAAAITGSLAWPRTAATGGKTPAAPPPMASPTTAAPTGLDPGLVAALEAAVAAARQAGHDLSVTSGFRTVAEQEALLADAIAEHGPTEALRWVFPPDRSMHVRGLAVDVGDRPAAEWLDDHGAWFGLCRNPGLGVVALRVAPRVGSLIDLPRTRRRPSGRPLLSPEARPDWWRRSSSRRRGRRASGPDGGSLGFGHVGGTAPSSVSADGRRRRDPPPAGGGRPEDERAYVWMVQRERPHVRTRRGCDS